MAALRERHGPRAGVLRLLQRVPAAPVAAACAAAGVPPGRGRRRLAPRLRHVRGARRGPDVDRHRSHAAAGGDVDGLLRRRTDAALDAVPASRRRPRAPPDAAPARRCGHRLHGRHVRRDRILDRLAPAAHAFAVQLAGDDGGHAARAHLPPRGRLRRLAAPRLRPHVHRAAWRAVRAGATPARVAGPRAGRRFCDRPRRASRELAGRHRAHPRDGVRRHGPRPRGVARLPEALARIARPPLLPRALPLRTGTPQRCGEAAARQRSRIGPLWCRQRDRARAASDVRCRAGRR